jgi:hypothetical protein
MQITSSCLTPQSRLGSLTITPQALTFEANGRDVAVIKESLFSSPIELPLEGLNQSIINQVGLNRAGKAFKNILTGQKTNGYFGFVKSILEPIKNKTSLISTWYDEVSHRAKYLNEETHGLEKGYRRPFPFIRQPLTAFIHIPHQPAEKSS